VVFGKPNLHGLYDKLGITKDSVERGKHAGIDSDYASLTPTSGRYCGTESTTAIGISSLK